jgi:hypothetical protein
MQSDNSDAALTTPPDNLLREESTSYNYGANGVIVAETDTSRNRAGCTSPPTD